MNASLFFPHLHSLFIVFFVGGLTLRNFGGAKLRIIETSVKSPLEKVENRIFFVFAT